MNSTAESTQARQVFDCFTYFNEVEVLSLRLKHLDPVVDRFVIVQATSTHSGTPNRHLLTENSPVLLPYSAKVRLHTVTDLPRSSNRWLAEVGQRNAIRLALTAEGARSHDLLVISDVDEIPNRDVIREIEIADDAVVALIQSLHYYRFDLTVSRDWRSARVVRAGVLDHLTPNEVRLMYTEHSVQDAGWHFSYLAARGDRGRKLREKVSSFAHSEIVVPILSEYPTRRGPLRIGHLGHLLAGFPHERLPKEAKAEEFRDYLEWEDGPSTPQIRMTRLCNSVWTIARRLRRQIHRMVSDGQR